ncbi:MAG: 3'(2'),5'-bisphosphate nucleotidase CysQ [Acidimicrobiaceae bacterium]|nr:3'(2'),5'-bisphosphate nucleotidase CysQ [Acidimicrobiaceae bacterium]
MGNISEFDHEFARYAAEEAGKLLLKIRRDASNSSVPTEEVGSSGDALSHELLVEMISETFPDDAIISEESTEGPIRHTKDRVWIIDPLDGTREYCIEGRSDWAVHVALVHAQKPVAAAVSLPSLGKTFSTQKPQNPPASSGKVKVVCSRTRPVPVAEFISNQLEGELLFMGSAGAKAMAVLTGDADIYAHAGGQYEWDSCAPVAVALAAGAHASRLDGSPVNYNQKNLYVPDLLICRKELANTVLTLLN